MAGTLTIPLATLGVGAHVFGPAAAADSDHGVLLSIDRTVTNGFNSQPASTTAGYRADAARARRDGGRVDGQRGHGPGNGQGGAGGGDRVRCPRGGGGDAHNHLKGARGGCRL